MRDESAFHVSVFIFITARDVNVSSLLYTKSLIGFLNLLIYNIQIDNDDWSAAFYYFRKLRASINALIDSKVCRRVCEWQWGCAIRAASLLHCYTAGPAEFLRENTLSRVIFFTTDFHTPTIPYNYSYLLLQLLLHNRALINSSKTLLD